MHEATHHPANSAQRVGFGRLPLHVRLELPESWIVRLPGTFLYTGSFLPCVTFSYGDSHPGGTG